MRCSGAAAARSNRPPPTRNLRPWRPMMSILRLIRLGNDVSIRTKLASLVALNVVVLAVVAFYCVRQVRCVRQEIHEIADQDIPLTKALSGLAHDQEETDGRLE